MKSLPGNRPATGAGLWGDASGKQPEAFSVENQPSPDAKVAGREARAAFRAKLEAKLDKVAEVYDAALVDEDNRVRLTAAKQISVELWGQPTQPLSGDDEKGPLAVVIRRFVEDAPGDDA